MYMPPYCKIVPKDARASGGEGDFEGVLSSAFGEAAAIIPGIALSFQRFCLHPFSRRDISDGRVNDIMYNTAVTQSSFIMQVQYYRFLRSFLSSGLVLCSRLLLRPPSR